MIHERITEDFFDREAPSIKAQIAGLEARLAAAPPAQVVSLHPATLTAYRAGMRHLSEIMSRADPIEDREIIDGFRSLIDRVVIHDGPGTGYSAEVIGALAPLIAPWGGKVVAEDRIGLPPHMPLGTFAA